MDREDYIMGQNYTLVVTSPFLCCADGENNYCIYVFFNDVKLVSKAEYLIAACSASSTVIHLIKMSCGLRQFQLQGSLNKSFLKVYNNT